MRKVFLIFLFVMSCGGGGNTSIILNMDSSLAPYYTKVSVRISGEEFDPILYSKEGTFYPGDVVTFNVNIPEGKERLVEAIIYDPEGNPVYYASKTLDMSKDTTLIMDMKPSQKRVFSYEVFSDGKKYAGGVNFYLFSEDLYSLNASFSTLQSGDTYAYMLGSYLAYHDGKVWRFLYLQDQLDQDIFLYGRYTLPIKLPDGITSMEVYGSYEGLLTETDKSVSVFSEKMLSDGTVVFIGYADGLYYSVSKDSVNFKKACQVEGECKALNIKFTGEKPDTYTLFASYGGIRFPITYGELFIYNPHLTYSLYISGKIKEPCVMRYSMFTELQNFTGSADIDIQLRDVSFESATPSVTMRVYSTDGNFEMEGSCESSAKGVFKIPYKGNVYVESVYPDGKSVGVFLNPEESRVSFPETDLEVLRYEFRNNYLFLKFKRGSDLPWCSLKLFSEGSELIVDKIPPWRSYFKIKNAGDLFGKLPDYTLRCYSEDKKYYVEVNSTKLHETMKQEAPSFYKME